MAEAPCTLKITVQADARYAVDLTQRVGHAVADSLKTADLASRARSDFHATVNLVTSAVMAEVLGVRPADIETPVSEPWHARARRWLTAPVRAPRWQTLAYLWVFWLAFVVTVIGWSAYLLAVLTR